MLARNHALFMRKESASGALNSDRRSRLFRRKTSNITALYVLPHINMTASKSTYIVDGLELNHVGHDSLKQVYFFTKEENGTNRLVEVPYSFEGVICPVV